MNAAHAAVESATSHGLLGKDLDTGLRPLHPDDAHDAHPALETFIHAALAQQGDQYIANATPKADDPDPHAFDCSSLVQWAAHQAGVQLNRTAEAQYLQLKGMGSTISVEQALHTPGALLVPPPPRADAGRGVRPQRPRGHQPRRRPHHRGHRLEVRRARGGRGQLPHRRRRLLHARRGHPRFVRRHRHAGGPPPGTDPAAAATLATAAHPPLPPRDDLPMPAAWRNVADRRRPRHARPRRRLVALPALPGVVGPPRRPRRPAAAGRRSPAPAPAGRGATAAHPAAAAADPAHPTADPLPPGRPTPCTRPPSTPPIRPTPTLTPSP